MILVGARLLIFFKAIIRPRYRSVPPVRRPFDLDGLEDHNSMEKPVPHSGASALETRQFNTVCEILRRNSNDPARLIPIPQQVQEEYRYLPEEVLTFIATPKRSGCGTRPVMTARRRWPIAAARDSLSIG